MIEPLAWAAVAKDGGIYVSAFRELAEEHCRQTGWNLLPLYGYPGGWQKEELTAAGAFLQSGCKRDWPDDEPETIPRITQCMAREILRLRAAVKPTDAEREALEVAVEYVGSAFQVEHHAATLRGLLERLG